MFSEFLFGRLTFWRKSRHGDVISFYYTQGVNIFTFCLWKENRLGRSIYGLTSGNFDCVNFSLKNVLNTWCRLVFVLVSIIRSNTLFRLPCWTWHVKDPSVVRTWSTLRVPLSNEIEDTDVLGVLDYRSCWRVWVSEQKITETRCLKVQVTRSGGID